MWNVQISYIGNGAIVVTIGVGTYFFKICLPYLLALWP